MCWMLFFITTPLQFYQNYFAFAALLFGMMRKSGIPEFNKAYLRKSVFDPNLQAMGYLMALSMVGGL